MLNVEFFNAKTASNNWYTWNVTRITRNHLELDGSVIEYTSFDSH